MELALICAQQVIVLFLLIGAGAAAIKTGVLKPEGRQTLSNLLVYLVVPAMIVHSYMMDFSEEILHNLLAAFGLSVLAILIGTVLTLALTEAGDGALGPVGQAPLLQKSQRLCLGCFFVQTMWLQAQGQFFDHGGEDDLVVRVLEHHAHPACALRTCGMQVLPLAQNLALVWHFQPAQQAQQTGFAHAVVPDQTDAWLMQLQAQAGKNGGATTLQAHLAQFQRGLG